MERSAIPPRGRPAASRALVSAVLLAAGASAAPAPDSRAGDACIACHRREERTAAIYEQWRRSVHAENNVSCSGCHGGDPSVAVPDPADKAACKAAEEAAHLRRSPEFLVLHAEEERFAPAAHGRSVSYFCGSCHAEIKEKHLGSPHGDFGAPTCLYCHAADPERPGRTTHAIAPSTLAIVDTRGRAEGGRCSPCHTQAAMEVVRTLKKLLVDSQAALEHAGRDHEWLLARGYRYLALGQMVKNSRQTRSRVRASFHSFNMREIQDACRAIDRVAKMAASAVEIARELEKAKTQQSLAGVGVSLFLLLFAGLLVLYRRRYCPDSAAASGSPIDTPPPRP